MSSKSFRRKMRIEQIEKQKVNAEIISMRLSLISTSSNNSIFGRKIIKQIRFISVVSILSQADAELDFLLAVDAVGGNGVLNMDIRTYGNSFYVKGDAVLLVQDPSAISNKELYYTALQYKNLDRNQQTLSYLN